MKALINSIYLATEGEGVFVGTPQVFVRFQGCTIGCLNCDSKDTWDFSPEYALSLDSVMEQVLTIAQRPGGMIRRVSITGGDPLHPKHIESVISLICRLKDHGFTINLEAAGSRVCDEIFDLIDFISFDIKTPSTGVETSVKNVEKLIEQYRGRYQIKSVIASKKDFDYVLGFYEKIAAKAPQNWVLTPASTPGEAAFSPELYQEIYRWNYDAGAPFRVIGQQHKWIFGFEKKV